MNPINQFIDRVTVTGADDNTSMQDIIAVTNDYPFVEWGILVSKSSMGGPRFPSLPWIKSLRGLPYKPTLSLHVCGYWVRAICEGNWKPLTDALGDAFPLFDRIQLNFHAQQHSLSALAFVKAHGWPKDKTVIFQFDGVNDELLEIAALNGCTVAPLFDKSGGAGIVPREWPVKPRLHTGYAGGLSPKNVASEIQRIYPVTRGEMIWIDAETHLRSTDNSCLDMNRVRTFLKAAKPFVLWDL